MMRVEVLKNRIFHWLSILFPIIAVNLFALLGMYFFFQRSIFYYEYFLVLIALWYFKKSWPAVLLYIIILLFDVFGLFSSLFLFQLNEFLASFQFASLYQFSFSQFALFMSALLYVLTIIYVLKKSQKRIHESPRSFFAVLFSLYGIVYAVDFNSGYNIFNIIPYEKRKITPENDPKNIISSIFYDFYKEFNKAVASKPSVLIDPSLTFAEFSGDTSGNQMTIVVESWGTIADQDLQHEFEKSLIRIFHEQGYHAEMGLTRYFGSTTSADMRELANAQGNYQYFIDKKSDTVIRSIFDHKSAQGYQTIAAHPFTGRMFSRSVWWKNLGPHHLYFRDDYILDHPFAQKDIEDDAHFPSVKDEAFFDYICSKTKDLPKKYVYYLTVNSHLPYKHHTVDLMPDSNFIISALPISDEAQSQLAHVKNFLLHIAKHISENNFDKVLIVGDHLPPFASMRDRKFYRSGKVPYLIAEKRN